MAQIAVATELETPSVERTSNRNYGDIKERYRDLFAYETVGRWLRKSRPRTMDSYLPCFAKFLQWTKTRINVENPYQLLAWAKAREGTIVQDLIDEYVAGSSIAKSQLITALIRSFLDRNGYRDLPKIDWVSTMNQDREGYSRAEVLNLLGFLDNPFQKLYVKAGVDSGLRANDLLSITYGQIKEDLEANQKFIHIRFPKEAYLRRKAPGRSFLGPNSPDLLRQLVKDGKISTDPKERIFPFVYSTITGSLKLAAKQAGLREDIQPSHGLRKFHKSGLDRAGLDEAKKNQLTGHSNGVNGTYTSKNIEELRELHAKAAQFLDLSETALTPQILLDLQKQNEEKTQHIEALKKELADKDVAYQKEMQSFKSKVEADLRRNVEEMNENMRKELRAFMLEERAKKKPKDGS